MTNPLRVLIVQNDAKAAQSLTRYFHDRGDQVWEAWDLGQAQALFNQTKPQLLVFDLHLPDENWINFIRTLRDTNKNLKVILTNQYPDLQREMAAKSSGFTIFLRQPFQSRWIDHALERLQPSLDIPTRPRITPRSRPAAHVPPPRVRIPMRAKITLPYLLLALIFALAAGFILTQVVVESVQDRFFNQLIAAGKQTSDWMVREEDRLLVTLRLVANTQGTGDNLRAGNTEALRLLSLPLVVNAADEAVALLDMQGTTVFSAHRTANSPPGEYTFARDETFFVQQDFVQRVLRAEQDSRGDKFAGFTRTPHGDYFYVSGPVFDNQNNLVGVVLVGKSAYSLVRQMKTETLSDATLYALNGETLATTLSAEPDLKLDPTSASQVLLEKERGSQTRSLAVGDVNYLELLAPWQARDQHEMGILGVALPQAFLVRTSQFTRVQAFVLITGGILLVIAVGVYLANLITRPLMGLVRASSQVAQGNLGVKVNVDGNDELAVLAYSFNTMIAGLQEGSIYRDLLGRTVSPEVREQLRQTFNTGTLRLEGQQAVATVLMSDIRGFTSLSEQAEPATVMNWLNEYYDRISPVIVRHGGVINKFDGDALLAFFGILPRMLEPQKSALAACQAAQDMLTAINELNHIRQSRGEPMLVTGIGINTGMVIAGGLGARDRLHYTIIGDTVNTTQRLEALTRQVLKSSGVLIGHATYTALAEHQADFTTEPLGLHSVKGKLERVMVYRLAPLDEKPKVDVML